MVEKEEGRIAEVDLEMKEQSVFIPYEQIESNSQKEKDKVEEFNFPEEKVDLFRKHLSKEVDKDKDFVVELKNQLSPVIIDEDITIRENDRVLQ
ncbi:uncharacterized protein A4U43_C04F9920 [Asparagus officinalis]|uniref:Uncharacterized protein n=1 Tax=Asparagus officinalis TaxID=4686 RepID=A0A5P1F4I0_ASPOF|nr:uncharacterized protein A4U43_C04F9920 [Asparagus officinalis]